MSEPSIGLIGIRLQQYAKTQGYTPRQASEALGEDPAFVARMVAGAHVNSDFIARMPQVFPHLNLRWLLTGQGTMQQHPPQPGGAAGPLEKMEKRLEALRNTDALKSEAAKARRLQEVLALGQAAARHYMLLQSQALDSLGAFQPTHHTHHD